AGFTGTAPDPAHSDAIDLVGIDFNSAQFTQSFDASKGLLSVSDGNHSASFTFDDFKATLSFASDGKGGTLITDPPATGANVDIGDGFMFRSDAGSQGQPGGGAFECLGGQSNKAGPFGPNGILTDWGFAHNVDPLHSYLSLVQTLGGGDVLNQ